MTYAVSTVIPPLVEPVTVEEAKLYAKLDGDEQDDLIAGYIQAARELAELFTNRSFISRTLKISIDACSRRSEWTPGFYESPVDYFDADSPSAYPLPRGPVASITSVTTYDALNAGTPFPSPNYALYGDRIALNAGYSWPSPLRALAGTEIIYIAGYGPSPSDVPRAIRMAILMHAAALVDDCGCEMSNACQNLLQPYRIMS